MKRWKESKYLPMVLVVDGERVALPRKLMLSTDTRKRIACPLATVSTSSKKPSRETYVLLDTIGFLLLYLLELKWAWTGRIDNM
jgi:hypothetical protein